MWPASRATRRSDSEDRHLQFQEGSFQEGFSTGFGSKGARINFNSNFPFFVNQLLGTTNHEYDSY